MNAMNYAVLHLIQPAHTFIHKVPYLCLTRWHIYADEHMTSTLKSWLTQKKHLPAIIVSNCGSLNIAVFVLLL